MTKRPTLPLRVLSVATLIVATTACGGSEKQTETPRTWELDDDTDDDGGMQVMQEFGGLNEEKVARVFERAQGDLSDCMISGQRRVEFLGGDVHFLVKVDMTGRAQNALIEESNLGDYETERCMVQALQQQRWPKPVGGRIGLARYNMGFDPDVRPPVPWEASDIEEGLAEISDQLNECGSGGPYTVTAYVARSGSVISAGVAHTDDNGEATAQCIVDTLRNAHFDSPGSWPAKVTFRR